MILLFLCRPHIYVYNLTEIDNQLSYYDGKWYILKIAIFCKIAFFAKCCLMSIHIGVMWKSWHCYQFKVLTWYYYAIYKFRITVSSFKEKWIPQNDKKWKNHEYRRSDGILWPQKNYDADRKLELFFHIWY